MARIFPAQLEIRVLFWVPLFPPASVLLLVFQIFVGCPLSLCQNKQVWTFTVLQVTPLDIFLPSCTYFHAFLIPTGCLCEAVSSSAIGWVQVTSQPVVLHLSTVFDCRMCSLLTSNNLHSLWFQRRRSRQSSSQTTSQPFLSECRFWDLSPWNLLWHG